MEEQNQSINLIEHSKTSTNQISSIDLNPQSTNSISINHNSLFYKFNPQHWFNLLSIFHSQTHLTSEWILNLSITSTSVSSKPLHNIFTSIHKRIIKQTSVDSQIYIIQQGLKYLYTQQAAKSDFRLEYQGWLAYMYLSITEYLIDLKLTTLAYRSLKANLHLFESDSVKAIFHLRIASIVLNEEDGHDVAKSHLAYATSLSHENSTIKLECDLWSAWLSFHQANFVKAFHLLTQLLEKNHQFHPRLQLINLQIISAIMSPPHLRKSYLENVKDSITEPDLSYLQELSETILSNSIIIPHSKPYKLFASSLQQYLISNGAFTKFIRIHNLWSQSIKTHDISSNELLTVLEFKQLSDAKSFIKERIEIDELKAEIITTNTKDDFYVQFTGVETKDERDGIDRIEAMTKKLQQLSTMPSSKPSCIKSQSTSTTVHTITITDTSEPESNEEKPTVIEIESDPETITPRNELRKEFEKEGIWEELTKTSATLKASHQAFRRTKDTRKKSLKATKEPIPIPKEESVFTGRLQSYLDFYTSIKPLSGWPITGLKVMIWKQYNPIPLKQFNKYMKVFEFARSSTIELFFETFEDFLSDTDIHESVRKVEKKSKDSGSRRELKKRPDKRMRKGLMIKARESSQDESRTLRKRTRKVKYTGSTESFSSSSSDEETKPDGGSRVMRKRKRSIVEVKDDTDEPAIRDTPAIQDSPTPSEAAFPEPEAQEIDEPMEVDEEDEIDQIDLPAIRNSSPITNQKPVNNRSSDDEKPREMDESDPPAIPDSSITINQEDSVGLNHAVYESDDEKSIGMDDIDPPAIPDLSITINEANSVGLENQGDEVTTIVDHPKEEEESSSIDNTHPTTSTTTNQSTEKNELLLHALANFSKALRNF